MLYSKFLIQRVSAPRTLHLTITTACNWRCIFCTVHEEKGIYYKTDIIKKVLDRLAEAGVTEVTLYGGEPSLHPDFIEIGRYAKDVGLLVGFISNGAKINELIIDDILDIFDLGSISIHGFRKTHERITQRIKSYEQAFNAIKLLDAEGFELAVCTTVCTLNLFNFDKFVKWMYYKFPNIKLFVVNRATFMGINKEYCLNRSEVVELVRRVDELSKMGISIRLGVPTPPCILPEELRKYASFCSAGVDFGNVDGVGNVKMCQSLSKTPTLGNVLEKPLSEIWNCEYLLTFREYNWIPEKCKNCQMFKDCFCGCKVSPDEHYRVDPIIYDQYVEYYTLAPNTKIREIDGKKVYSSLFSPSIIPSEDIAKVLDAIMSEPMTIDEILKFCESNNIKTNYDELRNILNILQISKLVIKVYRKNLEYYGKIA